VIRLKKIIFSALVLFFSLTPFVSAKDSPVQFYFFYAKDCPECQRVMKKIISPLKSRYPLGIKEFEINDLENYEKLVAFEEKFKDSNNKIPVVVIGDHLLSGEEEIRTSLELIIQDYAAKGGVAFLPIEQKGIPDKGSSGKDIYMAYFYKKGCRECDRVFFDLGLLKKEYPNLIVREFNIKDEDTKLLYEALGEHYRIVEKKRLTTPALIVGEDFLLSGDLDRKNIEDKIKKYQDKGSDKPWEIPLVLKKEAKKRLITRFESFGVYGIAIAGLIDGINPCAMATLVFFISYLSFIGRRSKEILLTGISYSFANFLAYLLVGLGLLKFLETITIVPVLVNALIFVMALFVLTLGFLSLYDYFLSRKGGTREIKLQLPRKIKMKIHETIRERTTAGPIIVASFIVGFLIAFQAFFCTGQVYLPTILFVSKISRYRYSAIGYLLLYNLFFILPLIVIFVLAFLGVRSESFSRLAEKRVGTVKILTSLLFFALGGILLSFFIFRI
jgi:hypothetical protein